jgi:hypothetical protein
MAKKNPNAVNLGRLGGLQRARNLSAEEISRIARKAGKARTKKLSAAERRRISMLGVKARQKKRRAKEASQGESRRG